VRGKTWSKHYKITVYTDDYGDVNARVDFHEGMSNSVHAESIVYAAKENAKRYIRNELKATRSLPLERTYYEVTENKIDNMNRMWSITMGEKI
jgi:hypothetical protein